MRRPDQLVHSRARVRQRYALLPLEGFPTSRLWTWPGADVRVLAAPALGAQFVQYLIDIPGAGGEGYFAPDDRIETFFYVVSGTGSHGGDEKPLLQAGDYGLLPPGRSLNVTSLDRLRLVVLRKRFERVEGVKEFESLAGSAAATVPALPYMDNPHARLQTLVPDDVAYDLAMNIFTFDPGHGLPYVETHVMEHGLLILEGKGLYYLDGEWLEVEKDDFIWMGPYCPQSFYATGPTPAKYIYYKNVNREVAL